MIFPYWEVLSETGRSRLLPVVPLTIHSPLESVEALALVDSGAEHNVFGLDLVDHLRLDTTKGREVAVVGVGGKESLGYVLPIELELARQRWATSAIFSGAVHSPLILGQLGFFDAFTVTFRYRQRQMDIRRARKTPN